MPILVVQAGGHERGLTDASFRAFLAGLDRADCGHAPVYLRDAHLLTCLACKPDEATCKHEGHCRQDDDFEPIRQRIRQSDGILFVIPSHHGTLHELATAMIERLHNTEGYHPEQSPLRRKPAAAIVAAAASTSKPREHVDQMRKALQELQLDVFEVFLVTPGGRSSELGMLEQAGEEFANSLTPT
jgi:multimeric flavodoxin WrbA